MRDQTRIACSLLLGVNLSIPFCYGKARSCRSQSYAGIQIDDQSPQSDRRGQRHAAGRNRVVGKGGAESAYGVTALAISD